MLLGAQIDNHNGNLKTIFPLPRDDGQRQKWIGVVPEKKKKGRQAGTEKHVKVCRSDRFVSIMHL